MEKQSPNLENWFQPENLEYVESIYAQYLADNNSVDSHWRKVFNSIEESSPSAQTERVFTSNTGSVTKAVVKESITHNYRMWGHVAANIDPLNLLERERKPELELAYYDINQEQLHNKIDDEHTIESFYKQLNQTYCDTVGIEFEHIISQIEKDWLYQRFENAQINGTLTKDDKVHLLKTLCCAENLEKHLASKYPGTKRFGLEGCESIIPALEQAILSAGALGAKEVVIGMPHRGRLNVLVNIMGKSATELFEEFEGKQTFGTTGDVKYHQGFSSNVATKGGEIHIAMMFNPSHLEIVSPVVLGSVRARQERRQDQDYSKVVPIILHGDAAFAGQGVVMETFQMSQTRAYAIGGTVHLIINNQIGFTTSRIDDARSTLYCTEVAKVIQAPIFHVNADDPERVIEVLKIALEYRYQYQKDVIVDVVGYRRRGHNETDEPSMTQPLMYQTIKQHKTTYANYLNQLIEQNTVTKDSFVSFQTEYRQALDKGEYSVPMLIKEPNESLFVDWSPYLNRNWNKTTDTSFDLDKLKKIAVDIATIPANIQVQSRVKRVYAERMAMAENKQPINWGMAEMLAYATIAEQGFNVRLSGQDSQRGTFSHRQSVLCDQVNGSETLIFDPLNLQGQIDIYNSLLSEEAVLAFEYGYSLTSPKCLVIWEAQFGDFANGAQVVIDQFIASGEHKWSRMSGMTLLLPHGYEGQGPEHSSARIERFLQLCADKNMQLCVPTTPSQIFHLLRLQIIRDYRHPLIVFTPKMLLRHSDATASLDELATGSFQQIIMPKTIDAPKITKVILCFGKIYYRLNEEIAEQQLEHIALIRIEQLYPFPTQLLQQNLLQFKKLQSVVWCQDEPINQGAWFACHHYVETALSDNFSHIRIQVAARPASSAPAGGYMATHLQEEQALIKSAIETK